MKTSDVIIVGGGMVGLTAAGLFAREGFQVTLLDGASPAPWEAGCIEGRVSALNPASRHLLTHIGVWQDISAGRAAPYTAMSVWDSHSSARITFDAATAGVPTLGHIVENELVCHRLRERLGQNYNVSLMQGVRVTGFDPDHGGRGAIHLENGESLGCELVVAADGARSNLRALAGIELAHQDFYQDAITATLDCENSHQDTARQVFTPDGPLAMLPLSGTRCSLVWSLERGKVDNVLGLDDDGFCKQLETHFGEHLGRLTLAGPRLRFPLGSRHASRYVASRLALAGDAAHTVHPLAGLGANLGLQDAAALAETVSAAAKRGKSINGQSVLRRYERWRRGENGIVLRAMQGFKSVFGDESHLVRQLRSTGFRVADNVMPLKHGLVQLAMGARGDLPAACRPHATD
jgi:2-octaprenylphenol hydroxylase